MTDTNEDIARAAGLDWPVRNGVLLVIRPDWRSDPGAVATYLLPVLERRVPYVSCFRHPSSVYGKWCCQGPAGDRPLSAVYGNEWHQAVINGILATREDK